MKRSEAIDLIKERLFNLPQDKAYLWKYIDEEADAILTELEDVGMLPPESKIKRERNTQMVLNGYPSLDVRMYYHTWDKE